MVRGVLRDAGKTPRGIKKTELKDCFAAGGILILICWTIAMMGIPDSKWILLPGGWLCSIIQSIMFVLTLGGTIALILVFIELQESRDQIRYLHWLLYEARTETGEQVTREEWEAFWEKSWGCSRVNNGDRSK